MNSVSLWDCFCFRVGFDGVLLQNPLARRAIGLQSQTVPEAMKQRADATTSWRQKAVSDMSPWQYRKYRRRQAMMRGQDLQHSMRHLVVVGCHLPHGDNSDEDFQSSLRDVHTLQRSVVSRVTFQLVPHRVLPALLGLL